MQCDSGGARWFVCLCGGGVGTLSRKNKRRTVMTKILIYPDGSIETPDMGVPSLKQMFDDDCNIKIVKHRYGEMEGIPLHFALKFSDYKWDLRGVLNFLWMYDIFFWRLPFLKSIIFANILVWLLLIKG